MSSCRQIQCSVQLVSDIDKYYVRNQAGAMVPLGTLISYEPTEAAPLISHFNIFRSAEIDGESPPGYSSTKHWMP